MSAVRLLYTDIMHQVHVASHCSGRYWSRRDTGPGEGEEAPGGPEQGSWSAITGAASRCQPTKVCTFVKMVVIILIVIEASLQIDRSLWLSV